MAEPESTTSSQGPTWIKNTPTLGAIFAFVLLGLYVLPVYLIVGVAWSTDGFQENSFYFGWFAAFMQSAESTLNQYHKLLMPLLTGLSVFTLSGKPTRWTVALVTFILASFFVTLCASVFFDMEATKKSLEGLSDKIDLPLAKAFFTRIQETLLAYIALLLGLQVTGAAKGSK